MKYFIVDAFADHIFWGNQAGAFVLSTIVDASLDVMRFNTLSGVLTVTKRGTLYCESRGDRVKTSGKAALYLVGELHV